MTTANQQLSLGDGHRDGVAAAVHPGVSDETAPQSPRLPGNSAVCNPGEAGGRDSQLSVLQRLLHSQYFIQTAVTP